MNSLQSFIRNNGMYPGYDTEYKESFKIVGKNFCNELAKQMRLERKEIYYNKAGIAVSGDYSMFGEKNGTMFYIHFNADDFNSANGYFRYVEHFKDFTGGLNHWFSIDSSIDEIAELIKKTLDI